MVGSTGVRGGGSGGGGGGYGGGDGGGGERNGWHYVIIYDYNSLPRRYAGDNCVCVCVIR